MYIKGKKEELDTQSKIVTILIVLLPLLRYYIPGLKPLMFSDVTLLYLVFIGVIKNRPSDNAHHVYVINALLLYGGYAIFATVLSSFYMPVFDYSSNITTLLRLWIYILIIYYLSYMMLFYGNQRSYN